MKAKIILSSFVTLTLSLPLLAGNGLDYAQRKNSVKTSKNAQAKKKAALAKKKHASQVVVQGRRATLTNASSVGLTKMQGPTTTKNAPPSVFSQSRNQQPAVLSRTETKVIPSSVNSKSAATSTLIVPTSNAAVAPSTNTSTVALTKATVPAAAPKKDFGFSGTFSITREAQAQNQVDKDTKEVSREETIGYELNPALKTWDFTTKAWFVYVQNLKKPEESEMQDIALVSTRAPFDVSKYFKFFYGAASTIPITKKTREDAELNTNLGGIIGTVLNTEAMGVKGLLVKASLTTTRNFHKATTSVAGEPLTQYSLLKKFLVNYELGDFSITALFWHYSNYSYENVVREKFLHQQELGYKLNDNLAFAIGHYNDAPMYKPSTYEYNLKFYDEASSFVYGKVEASF